MKLTVRLFIAVATLTVLSTAAPVNDAEYEYEDGVDEASPPPPKPSLIRPSVLGNHRQARGPSFPPPKGVKQQQLVKTTEAPAKPQAEEAEEEYDEEDQGNENPVTTTTPAPKKPFNRVRPFRSNDELLAALKRRRQQQTQHGGQVFSAHSTTTSEVPPSDKEKKGKGPRPQPNNGNGKRRTFGSAPAKAENKLDEPKNTTSPPRRYPPRSRPGATTQGVPEEQDIEEDTSAKPRSFRSGRKF